MMTKVAKRAESSLRSISTLQTLAQGAKPRERHQLANRYARLENDRARLEREIGMWESCGQMAAKRLVKVREEIDTLRSLLDEVPTKNAIGRSRGGHRRSSTLSDAQRSPSALSRTMELDY
jgi:hypothetical protein